MCIFNPDASSFFRLWLHTTEDKRKINTDMIFIYEEEKLSCRCILTSNLRKFIRLIIGIKKKTAQEIIT